MSLIVEIPDTVREGLRLSDHEAPSRLRSELALALYQQDLLSFGKAAELADMTRDTFAAELGRRNIPRHYSEEDASMDAAYAGRQ
jgi:predicted HTH domain antitoxin